MYKYLILFLQFAICFSGYGQNLTGRIVDAVTQQPVVGAEVAVQGTSYKYLTNSSGEFDIVTAITDPVSVTGFDISVNNGVLYWNTRKEIYIRITNILGQTPGFYRRLGPGSGSVYLPGLTNGICILNITVDGISKAYKIICNKNFHAGNIGKDDIPLKSAMSGSDTLIITRDGYYDQKYAYLGSGQSYGLLKLDFDGNVDYLEQLPRLEAYVSLQGLPLTPTFGEVKSIKLVYSIPDSKLYYVNSKRYQYHYSFATYVLGYSKGLYLFNQEQYSKNPNRTYFLATLNHFTASDIYTFDFISLDEWDCSDIEMVYNKIAQTSYIGNKLKFYPSADKWGSCSNVPIIASDELYEGQNYQPLNAQENYGYLKKLTVDELNTTYLGRHDIVLLDDIPLDISVVAGIITTKFQTPLSHVNVLSHNRGTPNMALRDGWTNPKINDFVGKLVYFNVSLDSFYIREATLDEAQIFWSAKEPQTPQVLKIDTLTTGIIDLTQAGISDIKTIGGKAANFGELTKINVSGYGPLVLPEGYFAIPFYYYWQHIKKYGLDKYIDQMLQDDSFWSDVNVRQQKLDYLRESIKYWPVDSSLLSIVNQKLSTVSGYDKFRFRSSTNAEDIAGFNGAGLYDSYTGSPTDPDKPIEKAIKKTWASLWNFRAFEEREYFKIDHKSVAMGILINRSFSAEEANGVVITENIFNKNFPAFTINVQVGEVSIVKPTDDYLPDQIIYYTAIDNTFEYVSHSNVPGMEGKTVLTNNELKVLKDYCMAIHYHYCVLNMECHPMDIEFKVDMVAGKRTIYIKQARRY